MKVNFICMVIFVILILSNIICSTKVSRRHTTHTGHSLFQKKLLEQAESYLTNNDDPWGNSFDILNFYEGILSVSIHNKYPDIKTIISKENPSSFNCFYDTVELFMQSKNSLLKTINFSEILASNILKTDRVSLYYSNGKDVEKVREILSSKNPRMVCNYFNELNVDPQVIVKISEIIDEEKAILEEMLKDAGDKDKVMKYLNCAEKTMACLIKNSLIVEYEYQFSKKGIKAEDMISYTEGRIKWLNGKSQMLLRKKNSKKEFEKIDCDLLPTEVKQLHILEDISNMAAALLVFHALPKDYCSDDAMVRFDYAPDSIDVDTLSSFYHFNNIENIVNPNGIANTIYHLYMAAIEEDLDTRDQLLGKAVGYYLRLSE